MGDTLAGSRDAVHTRARSDYARQALWRLTGPTTATRPR